MPSVSMINKIYDLPRCEALRETPYADDTRKTNKQCRCKAKIKFNGKHLCKRHAEVFALQYFLEKTDVKK